MHIFEFMENIQTLQKEFLKEIGQKVATNSLLSNEIAKVLEISKSEAYNKISGKSALTLTQVNSLCTKYNVDFEIKKPGGSLTCKVAYTPFHAGKTDMGKYLVLLNKFMNDMAMSNVSKLSCATDDIPFFHLFKYPELAAFKLHFWDTRIPKKNISNANKNFDFKKANKKNIRAALELHKTYSTIPCLEIWTKSYLLIIIDQIKYAYESQLLKDKKLANIICDQLLHTLADVENYALFGSKSKTKEISFDWYQCDVVGNVAYLADIPGKQICFLRFNTFNNFQSDDGQLCNEVDMWMKFLLNNATGFSGQGSKQRNNYLHNARETIQSLKEKFAEL